MAKYLMCVLFLLYLLCGIVHAEDQNTQETPPPSTAAPPAKEPAQKNPLPEFTPSEEISADKPVAFPVNI